jgi:DNA repair exonuclease SbcCD ATPase subunit
LEESLETKTTEQPAETSSIVEAANLLIKARELVTRAETVRSQGQRATAKRLYRTALEGVPALNSAYNALTEINRREANEAVESRISTGNALIESGDVEEAVAQYRSALNAGTAADETLTDRAVGNIIQVLSQREQRNIAEKNSDITSLRQRISELLRESQEREEAIAELNSTLEERNRNISELRTDIDRREEEIAGLEDTVDRKNGEIDRLEEQIASRENRIESLTESLEDKTSEAERLSETLEGKEGETGSLSATIEEKNERITELSEDVQELNNRLEEVQTELRASRRGLSQRNETINSLQRE